MIPISISVKNLLEKLQIYSSKMDTTYKYVHLDKTNLRAEMEQGAL
jgi:hypothetical protein